MKPKRSTTRFSRWALLPPVLPLMLALAPMVSVAQVERSGGGANQQLYQDYQQAVAERTQLQSDNAKLKQQLAGAQQQLAAVKQRLAASQAGAGNTQAALAAAQAAQTTADKNQQTLRQQISDLVFRFRQTISQLQDAETDRTNLRAQVAQGNAALDKCAVANDQLYQVDNDVLNRYAHQGAFSYLTRAEPFTRLERTRIDNLVLEYRGRAEQFRLPASGATTSSAAAKSPASAAAPAAEGAGARDNAAGRQH